MRSLPPLSLEPGLLSSFFSSGDPPPNQNETHFPLHPPSRLPSCHTNRSLHQMLRSSPAPSAVPARGVPVRPFLPDDTQILTNFGWRFYDELVRLSPNSNLYITSFDVAADAWVYECLDGLVAGEVDVPLVDITSAGARSPGAMRSAAPRQPSHGTPSVVRTGR